MTEPFTIEALDAGRMGEWQAFVDAREDAGPMDHAGWLGILQDSSSVTPHFLIARDAGDRVRGIMPMYHTPGAFGPAHLATLQDGLLADEAAAAALSAHAEALRDRLRLPYLLVRDGRPCGRTADQRMEVVHTVIDTQQPVDDLWQALAKKTRYGVRQATKNGFVSGEEPIDGVLPHFYRLYAEHMRHLGTPVFGFDMLTAMRRHLGTERLRFFGVRRDGVLVGGMICITNGERRISSLYALVDRRLHDLFPNYLLYWTAIEAIAGAGFAEFDLGRSTVESGVHGFKGKWRGSDILSDYQYFVRPGETRDFTDVSVRQGRSLKQRVWQRLPPVLCNTLGPMIRRRLPIG